MSLLSERLARAPLLRHAKPFYGREALLCLPALPLLMIGGLVLGHPIQGAVAAGAAFSVGFGAARDLAGRRWAAMLAAALGMALAALVGSLTGAWLWVFAPICALAAAGCAYLALVDEDLWWVALQVVIALLVAGYYPGPASAALQRTGLVLLGGAAQMAVTIVLAWLIPNAAHRLPRGASKLAPPLRLVVGHLSRAAICVALSLVAARVMGLANSYWAPMTALIVLKPHLHETRVRGVARLGGTLAGCLAASLFAMAVGYGASWLLAGLTLGVGLSYALQKAHYAALTSAITFTVVLLLSLVRGDAVQTAEHRILATLIGGLLALGLAQIAPHATSSTPTASDHVGA